MYLNQKKKILTLPLLQFSPNLTNKDRICPCIFKIQETTQTNTVALRKQIFKKKKFGYNIDKLTALLVSVACAALCCCEYKTADKSNHF